jgi:hypothetical protein
MPCRVVNSNDRDSIQMAANHDATDDFVYMTMVTLVRTGSGSCLHPDSQIVEDAIWVLAGHEARLEHVRVLANAREIGIMFFSGAQSASQAHSAVTALCARACQLSPLLHGWQVRR